MNQTQQMNKPVKRKFKANRTLGKNIESRNIPEKKPEQELTGLLEKYLRYCANNKGLKPQTIKTYSDITNRLIKWLEKEFKIIEPSQVTGNHIDEYIDYIINDRGNSKNYANIIIRNSKPFFKWLTQKEHIPKSPYDGIKLLRVDLKKKEPIPEENFKKLLQVPSRDYFGNRDTLILQVLYGCGLRIGECLNLKIRNVDLENDRIFLEDTKNREDSFVPLPAYLKKPLKSYIGEYLSSDHVDNSLFQNQNGSGLTVRSFQEKLKKYCEVAKIIQITCHQFRHNFAINWLMNGGDTASLQRVLRHKDPKMVNLYLNWVPKAITEKVLLYNPLDKLFLE